MSQIPTNPSMPNGGHDPGLISTQDARLSREELDIIGGRQEIYVAMRSHPLYIQVCNRSAQANPGVHNIPSISDLELAKQLSLTTQLSEQATSIRHNIPDRRQTGEHQHPVRALASTCYCGLARIYQRSLELFSQQRGDRQAASMVIQSFTSGESQMNQLRLMLQMVGQALEMSCRLLDLGREGTPR